MKLKVGISLAISVYFFSLAVSKRAHDNWNARVTYRFAYVISDGDPNSLLLFSPPDTMTSFWPCCSISQEPAKQADNLWTRWKWLITRLMNTFCIRRRFYQNRRKEAYTWLGGVGLKRARRERQKGSVVCKGGGRQPCTACFLLVSNFKVYAGFQPRTLLSLKKIVISCVL